jgi:hypothetical protein
MNLRTNCERRKKQRIICSIEQWNEALFGRIDKKASMPLAGSFM